VITPSVAVYVDVGEVLSLRADYEADIVSGASVAIVDAPSPTVDAITSATQLDDLRHTVGGSIGLNGETTSLTTAYHYGFESDYRSHSVVLAGRTELFERNTTLEVSYGRGWDSVCNLFQPRAQEAVDRLSLPSSDGCFSAADREATDVSMHTFQGSWSQAWTSIFATQFTVTAQLLHGFQGNPYRSLWLGRSSAQEHHPEDRARYAAGLGVRLWLRPLEGALQAQGRVYRDSWNIQSLTAELGYEQDLFAGLRLRGRARYYTQTGASFYSDDYTRAPRGQYFTGDRELSPMSSLTFGARLAWEIPSNEEGLVLGFLSSVELVAKADWTSYEFDEFHYDLAPVPNTDALMATVTLDAQF